MLGCLALFLLCACFAGVAHAGARDAVELQALTDEFVGRSGQILVEGKRPLDFEEALAALHAGEFRPVSEAVPKFGIGAAPVWFHIALRNTDDLPALRALIVGVSWIDRLDVHLRHESGRHVRIAAGDGDAALQHPEAGLGYVFESSFAPGLTDVLIRAETADPLPLPVRLLTPASLLHERTLRAYGYGALYGFLLALVAYNAMLYAGLRERSYLDYALYLGAFILTDLAYTGHGYALLWPAQAGLQRFVILVMMVVFCALGLRFARGFLRLEDSAPRLDRSVQRYAQAGLVAIGAAVVLRSQGMAALVAFLFVLSTSLIMVTLGLDAVRRGVAAGRYLLAAALAAMTGAAATALGVWRGLPYSLATLHVAELGVALEGILLALGLAHRVREHRRARESAEHLASIDSLTGLLNRRAFLERAAPLWSTALRNDRPLSLLMVDIDHFKSINDRFGHAVGDDVLAAFGKFLFGARREGDLVARWGGEEFILLLPETGLSQAHALGERLRVALGRAHITASYPHPLSASFGLAGRNPGDSLEVLIRAADAQLYRAKAAGRNRVCSPPRSGIGAEALLDGAEQ
ncbi:MAG: diguanylate cyclase [Rhodocyclaceae bacterium]